MQLPVFLVPVLLLNLMPWGGFAESELAAVSEDFENSTLAHIRDILKQGSLANNATEALASGRIAVCEPTLLTPVADIPASDVLDYMLECEGYTGELVLLTTYTLPHLIVAGRASHKWPATLAPSCDGPAPAAPEGGSYALNIHCTYNGLWADMTVNLNSPVYVTE